MYKNSGLVVLSMLILGLLVFSSCDPSTSTELADSFETVKEVQPVEGAQNVTMNLEKGGSQNSFFTVTLDGGREVEGWCIEWDEMASFGLNEGTKMYSTKGQEAWKEINYFMKNMNDFRASDPDLGYREIQVVIWSLIDKPAFDVDKIAEYEHISARIYNNGQPLFDVQKVKDIVSQVRTATGKQKGLANSGFTTQETTEYGVYLLENDGQTIMVGDETAFAVKTEQVNGETVVDSDVSTCFDEEIIEDVSWPRWGWTNGPIEEGSGEMTYDIYAGAGQCDLSKGKRVGELTVNYSAGTFTATYRMTETSPYTDEFYTMTETHLYVGTDPYPMKKGDYTVDPGHYGNVDDDHDYITEYTYEITGLSGPVYFIAHAVVSGFTP